MIWLVFLFYWRRVLEGRRRCRRPGLPEPDFIVAPWVCRPLEAPQWSVEDRKRFESDLQRRLRPTSGRLPLLTEAVGAPMLTNEARATLNLPPMRVEKRRWFYRFP